VKRGSAGLPASRDSNRQLAHKERANTAAGTALKEQRISNLHPEKQAPKKAVKL
jgi:hypothetical protein